MASPSDSQQPPHSFPHRTSSAAPRQPFLNTSLPAINSAPVELDSTPVSPVARQHSWPTTRAGGATIGDAGGAKAHQPEQGQASGTLTQDQQDEKNRVALLEERSRNPAVLVSVPEEPGAHELVLAASESTQRHAEQQQ